jgi:hypothetical protein
MNDPQTGAPLDCHYISSRILLGSPLPKCQCLNQSSRGRKKPAKSMMVRVTRENRLRNVRPQRAPTAIYRGAGPVLSCMALVVLYLI